MSKILSIGESGRLMVGKDYVAAAAGFDTIMGFADPMYEIAYYFFGTKDKSTPGMREFLQKVGQWGWGANNENYPWSVERAAFVDMMRRHGQEFTENFKWVDWTNYGKFGFWVNILVERVDRIRREERFLLENDQLYSNAVERKLKKIAVPNVRFQHEYEPLNANGDFTFVHIMCSQETREERMKAKGYVSKPNEANDLSEQFAFKLDARCLEAEQPWEGAPLVVWNDHRPKPRDWFLYVEDFVALVNEPADNIVDPLEQPSLREQPMVASAVA